jgi:phage antirepressor YoqD-like protein
MTVKEVADVLGLDPRTIQLKVKELFPEITKERQTTHLTETQVTSVKLSCEKKFAVVTEMEKELIIMQAMQFQKEKIIILEEKNAQLEGTIKMLVHDFKKTYTTTEIAKELHLRSAHELNLYLYANGIQYKQNGTWVLYSDYSDKGYTSIKETVLDSGKIVYDRLWTGSGRKFILDLYKVINHEEL